VLLITPVLLNESSSSVYFLFGGLALGTVVVLAAIMPETCGRSLENIQETFQGTTSAVLRQFLRTVSRVTKLPARTQVEDNEYPIGIAGSGNVPSLRAESESRS